MSRPDSGAISTAVVGALQADATLAGLMPEGVWYGLAAPGLTRFVLVTLQDGVDDHVFGQPRAIEERLYAVKAVGLSRDVTIATMKQAAHRIDELLGLATLDVPGFVFMDCDREPPMLEDPVPDPVDVSLVWHHYGAHYRVRVAWPDPVATALNVEGSNNGDQKRPVRESELGSGGGLGHGADHLDQHLEG
jgi:hypothetical protein